MRTYPLRPPAQQHGGFTNLFVLGTTATASGSTDFTDADTAQAVTLTTLAIGDVVFTNLLLEVITNFAGSGLSAATGSVGITGTVTQFTAASNLLAAGTEYYTPANSVTAYPASAAIAMIFDLILTGANCNALTAGEVWIWACISRKAERSTRRQA